MGAGATLGWSRLLAAPRVGEQGRVYAFEPSRREFERLCHNLQANRVKNVAPYASALSDRTAALSLTVAPRSHTGINRLSDDIAGSHQLVSVLPGDVALAHVPDGQRVGIKADVEGAGLSVLRGLPG